MSHSTSARSRAASMSRRCAFSDCIIRQACMVNAAGSSSLISRPEAAKKRRCSPHREPVGGGATTSSFRSVRSQRSEGTPQTRCCSPRRARGVRRVQDCRLRNSPTTRQCLAHGPGKSRASYWSGDQSSRSAAGPVPRPGPRQQARGKVLLARARASVCSLWGNLAEECRDGRVTALRRSHLPQVTGRFPSWG